MMVCLWFRRDAWILYHDVRNVAGIFIEVEYASRDIAVGSVGFFKLCVG